MFKKNEGPLDRLLRATLGVIALLSGLLWLQGAPKWLAIIIALLLFFTSAIGHCTPYSFLKINTLKYGKNWPSWVAWVWLAVLFCGAVLIYFK